MSARVSVVIPAYNAARFAGRAIASALAEPEVAEVIVVNDVSTDDTAAVLAGLARDEPRLRILQNARNLGPGGTRNAGLAAATGDWIALLDADDAFAPGRLSRLLGVAEAHGLDVVADLLVLYDLSAGAAAPDQPPASGRVQRLVLADLLRPDPETALDLGLMKPVFRRHLAQTGAWSYPEAVRHGEDFALYFDLIGKGVPFGLLHEAHYIFSTRIGAISGSYSPGSVTDVDYRSIAAHAAVLETRYGGGSAPDPEVLALLRARVARALRQNRVYGWTALRRGDVRRLWNWLRRDRRNLPEMAAMLAAKLRGHRGLPD